MAIIGNDETNSYVQIGDSERQTAGDSERLIILNPEDPQRSFGINPLYCADITSLSERNAAYKKTKGLFDKIWKIAFEQTPWLQSNLENAIYAFIENPGSTLLELPIFYRNAQFRDYVVSNIRYNWRVRDYWNLTFASKTRRDQDEQLQAAQSRAETLLANQYVADILGQTESTLDFSHLIAEKKIILVKLPSTLHTEAQTVNISGRLKSG